MTHSKNQPASPKRALAPDTAAIDDRAARAWTERMAITPLGHGRYAVDSESGASYTVDLPEGRCSCPDSTYRDERCKHLRRTALEVTHGLIAPPGKREAVCAQCGTRTFVDEDALPALCSDCELTPGDFVRDRETGDPLIVAEVIPKRAEAVGIPGTDYSVATYPTNSRYAATDVVVEAVYLSATDESGDERPRYAFPISRLERLPRSGNGSDTDGDDEGY